MQRRDQILREAERLAKRLPSDSKNEVKRVLHFYLRHRDYDRPFELLDYPLPQRGKKESKRWTEVGKVLKESRNRFAGYSADEVAFILGWASRLLSS